MVMKKEVEKNRMKILILEPISEDDEQHINEQSLK